MMARAQLILSMHLLELLIGLPRWLVLTLFTSLVCLPFWLIFDGRPFYLAPDFAGLALWGASLAFLATYFPLLRFWAFSSTQYMTFLLGARPLTVRETALFATASRTVLQRAGQADIGGFREVYMVDSLKPTLMSVGQTLYISSSALEMDFFCALYAHELGHLVNGDSRLILALASLLPRPARGVIGFVERVMRSVPYSVESYDLAVKQFTTAGRGVLPERNVPENPFSLRSLLYLTTVFLSAGLSIRAQERLWAEYFRQRDLRADGYAVHLGFREDLLSYLERYRPLDTAVPNMLAWTPAYEERIDALLNPALYG